MGKLIMTVDDSPVVRQGVKLILETGGYEVVEAEHGRDALVKLFKNKVNMMIVDYNMPVMNGVELIKEVRKLFDYKNIPIIMLTTESQLEKKQLGKLAGATGWVTKPVQGEKLLKVVKMLLG